MMLKLDGFKIEVDEASVRDSPDDPDYVIVNVVSRHYDPSNPSECCTLTILRSLWRTP